MWFFLFFNPVFIYKGLVFFNTEEKTHDWRRQILNFFSLTCTWAEQSFSGMIDSQASAWSWPLFHEGMLVDWKKPHPAASGSFIFIQQWLPLQAKNLEEKNDTTSNSGQPMNLPPGLHKLQLVLVRACSPQWQITWTSSPISMLSISELLLKKLWD